MLKWLRSRSVSEGHSAVIHGYWSISKLKYISLCIMFDVRWTPSIAQLYRIYQIYLLIGGLCIGTVNDKTMETWKQTMHWFLHKKHSSIDLSLYNVHCWNLNSFDHVRPCFAWISTICKCRIHNYNNSTCIHKCFMY